MGKEFDELSKALASGLSRRQALRRFGLGLFGAAVAAMLPWRTSEAQEIQDCNRFCRDLVLVNGAHLNSVFVNGTSLGEPVVRQAYLECMEQCRNASRCVNGTVINGVCT